MKTTFKSFITEADGKQIKKFSIEETASYLKKDASIAWNERDSIKFWRNAEYTSEFNLLKPSQIIRRATTNYNIANTFVSNDETWIDFPPRNQSTFFSTSSKDILKYSGDTYRIFPNNNALLGICPADDFWFSFSNSLTVLGINDIDKLDSYLAAAIDTILNKRMKAVTSFRELTELFDKVNRNIKKNGINAYIDDSQMHHKLIAALGDTTINQLVSDILNPLTHGFKTCNMNNIPQPGMHEFWTNADCIAVPKKSMDKLTEYMK